MIVLRREALAGSIDCERLLELPNFVRSAKGSYWHIPRAAERWRDGRVCVSAWCGIGIGSSRRSPGPTFVDVAPAEMVCGTCSGRFEGATADDSPLIFRPRDDFAPPTWCPCADTDSSGRHCLACGARLRGSWWGVGRHHPGPEFVERCSPCPDHGWKHAWTSDGRVLCWVFVGMGWGRCDFDCGPRSA